MKLEETIHLGNLSGLAYVKNSEGRSGNVNFYASAIVNTKTGVADISYNVSVFNGMKDAFSHRFKDYQAAVIMYNELAAKWDAHRTELIKTI